MRRKARSEPRISWIRRKVAKAGKSLGASESCTRKVSTWEGGTWPNRWDSENERSADRIRGVLPPVPREVGHAPTAATHFPRWGHAHYEPFGLQEAGRPGHLFQRPHAGVQPCRERHRHFSHDHQPVL